MAGFLFWFSIWKQQTNGLETEGRPHTIGDRFYKKNRDCLWNTEFEHCRKKTDRANALQKIVQELNCLELAVQEVKFIIKKICPLLK